MKNKVIYLILLIISVVYYSTTAKTLLPNGDSGELVTTAFFGGIAHPPGYPLYNLIGHLFLKLPILGEPAFRLNLMSAILHIFCLLFVYKSFLLLTNNKYFLSILLVFALAFSYSFWLYSGIAEVFALHDLLFSILFFLFLKIYFSKKQKDVVRLSLFWAFVFGLSMSNNHLIVLILPAFVFLLYQKNTKYKYFESIFSKTIVIAKLLLCFLIGLLPYTYFYYVRNNINPVSWIYPTNFGDMLRLFFRLNYGNFLNYHDYGFVGLQKNSFFINAVNEMTSFRDDFWLISWLAPIAFFFVFFIIKKIKKLRKYLFLAFIPHILLLMIFKIGFNTFTFSVFERFFLTFHITLIFFVAIFLSYFLDLLKKRRYVNYSCLILIFLVFFMFLINYKKANQVNNNICRDYYDDLIKSSPENSTIIMSGDIQTFCVVYHHYVVNNFQKNARILILSNYFLKKNNGKFLTKYYNYHLTSMEDIYDLVRKGKKNIFDTGRDIPPDLYLEPHGMLNILRSKKTKIDYDRVYEYNAKWFKKSQLLTRYSDGFVNLSNRALKELYCREYLGLVVLFLDAKKNEYAKKIYIDFNRFCQADDFSVPESANFDLSRVKAKFPSVTH